MLIDRIENTRFEKNIKLFKWVAILSFLLVIVRILFDLEIMNGGGKLSDLFTSLIPVGMFFQYRSTAKKWGGQFFEWKENEVEFKSRKYDKTVVTHNSIIQINIKLDIIEIKTNDKLYEINIEDYTEYNDRLRLKNNFEQLKKKLSTTVSISTYI